MIQVTCAIIEDRDKILCAQRSEHMKLPLKWEFPGGKIEAGESPQACLIREIQEELAVDIEILEALPANIHSYGTKSIELLPFRCRIVTGTIQYKEHKEIRWLKPQELPQLDWAAADIPIVERYIEKLV